MFSSYDFKRFGSELKLRRNRLKLSQKAVSVATGVHQDTLRRIENGRVIPKYETIEVLSVLYKTDLLLLLKSLRSDYELENLYVKMDKAILSHQYHKIKELEMELEKIKASKKGVLINEGDLDYLEVFIKASGIYHNDPQNMINAKNMVIKVLGNLDISKPLREDEPFNLLEVRLLMLLSAILMDMDEFKECLNILEFTLSVLKDEIFKSQDIVHMVIITYVNISYCNHRIDNHKNALMIANEGITYANQHYSLYGVYSLLSRKAVAEYLLGDENYKDTIKKNRYIMEFMNIPNKLELYAGIFKEKYNIDIYEF